MIVDELVARLCAGDHHVEASLRPEKTVKALEECIDRGYVHIKFTETKGGTELGVKIDRQASDISKADFDAETGSVHLVGTLTLNYMKVQCVADIDLKTLEGKGRLVLLES
ncbi:MAG: MbtH domain protein [Gammaproteobacteria bacterium]